MEKKTPPQSQQKSAWSNQGALRDQLRAQSRPSAQQTGQTGAQQQVGQYAFSQEQTRQETIDDYAASISSYKGLAGPVLAISLALALLSALAMCAAVLVRPVSRPALYLACACATSIAPTAAAAIAIWRDRSPDNIRHVSGRLKLVLMATTLSFLLLV